jgi:hypothetical protein
LEISVKYQIVGLVPFINEAMVLNVNWQAVGITHIA